ncbi:SpoIID/LytB domain-containing protein [Bacillus sp. ISL-18]|uniref:SpoIID/LytB domain-containing protein n=1 Tax=Bacillus sp. ISL-18 TaxID=2819118 RepID=UPI001BE9169C|nr:SpoIID/LytB domain-containing protein [Bacillus sp. ISL-18]MBT2658791.1 SpoIID/LytB domain-containing protein [Bacillus sp. ISL-18]
MNRIVVSFLSFFLLFNLFISGVSADTIEPKLQVKLVNYIGNQTQLTIRPTGDYLIQGSNLRLKNGTSYVVKYDSNRIIVLEGSTTLIQSDSVNLIPSLETNYLTINNRPYLGSFRFIPENSKYVRPINEVFIEDYLKGVVPFEMMAGWKKEALKSQAVAARTYALSYLNKVMDDTINYQVYGGYAWHPNSTAAVDETKGEVLKSNGRMISAVFSASNGGKTESNANVWGTLPVAYLTIKTDEFDAKTPWTFSVKKQQINPAIIAWDQMKETDASLTSSIKTWMLSHGYAGKDIKITAIPVMSLTTPTSGGRVSKGNITIEFLTKDKVDPSGLFTPQKLEYKNVPASQVRAMVGIRTMLSYLVTTTTETTEAITVSGLGDGHGVGLSQWGAKNRADAGQTYKEILAFYYDGTTLSKEYTERPQLAVPSSDASLPPVVETPASGTVTPPVAGTPANGTATPPAVETPANGAATPPVVETPKADTIAPKISSVKVSADNAKNKATISFYTDEKAKITIYIKDSNGKILTYLAQNVLTERGTTTKEYSTSPLANGKYFVGIIAIDESNNQASTLPSFDVKKIVPVKDTTAPKLTGIKVSVNNCSNTGTLIFNSNETAKLTVYVKDSKGKILTYLKKDALTKAGILTLPYSTAPYANGKYTIGINAVDPSNNKSSAAASFEVKKLKTGKVIVSLLHVRTSASSKAKIIGVIKKNQTVTILSTSGGWYRISYGKLTGFVPKTAVK